MTRLYLLLILVLPLALGAQAAAVPDPRSPIPERPSVATHAFTVAPGYLELETGIESDFNQDHTHAWLIPTLMKVGLTSRVQLGVSLNLAEPPGTSFGVGDAAIGIKYRLYDNLPLLGAFAILPAVKLPTGNAAHGTTTTDGSVLLISSHKFGDASLDINVGYTHRSGNGDHAPINATLWTVSGGIPVSDKVGFGIEISGVPATTGPAGTPATSAFLAGPTIAIGPHSVLDFGGILHFAGSQPDAFYVGWTHNLGHF